MLPETRSFPFAGGLDGISLPPAWRIALLRLVPAWLVLIAIFLPDWAAMARQWWDSSTYNHILLIPAILAWLVWQRAGELAKLKPTTWWPGLCLAGAAAFIWLLGAFSGLDLARQFGTVLMLIAASMALLGPKVSAGLAFPLGYMLLLVPFGDVIVPQLQMITTAITIALVKASGIPVQVDGVFIQTPAGLFEVAEACSGVKFLIAMIALGLLIANVCFASWKRRVWLLLACLVIPILANGLRAFGTIYAAQLFGIETAAGFDHIFYGWFFFAFVVSLVILGSWRFFDRPADEPLIRADRIEASPLLTRAGTSRLGAVPALAILLILAAGSHVWAQQADRLTAELPRRIALPDVPGWHRVDYAPRAWWEPRAEGADHRLLGRYEDAQGRQVDVFLALYARQGEGSDAGGFGQGALAPDSGWSWLSPARTIAGASSERLLSDGAIERLALTWYRTGGLTTGSNVRLKLANMADRLMLRRHATIMLILSAEEADGRPALEAIERFAGAAGPLDRWMDRIAGLQ